MKLFLMRHSVATSLLETGLEKDEERPLTAEGEERARIAGRALKILGVAPEEIWSSPVLRARQTAEIVAAELGEPFLVDFRDVLKPGMSAAAFWQCMQRNPFTSLMVIGHQPDLGNVISFLLWDLVGAPFLIEPGVAVCLHLPSFPSRERARIEFLLSPELAEKLLR
jgi:phosphohistidine phosphatase